MVLRNLIFLYFSLKNISVYVCLHGLEAVCTEMQCLEGQEEGIADRECIMLVQEPIYLANSLQC